LSHKKLGNRTIAAMGELERAPTCEETGGTKGTPPVLLGRSAPPPAEEQQKAAEETSPVKRTTTFVRRQWSARMRRSAEDLARLERGATESSHGCEQTSISFKDVSFSAKLPSGEEKEILAPVTGHWESGNLVAVMGPSGCGKSTLLDILAEKKSAAYSALPATDSEVAPCTSTADRETSFSGD